MEYQRCTRCIMDTTDPSIRFDENGVCNHCTQWFEMWNNRIDRRPIEQVVEEIKSRRQGRYDAVLGISGGVDSTYTAYLAKKHDLEVLLLHADSGWNSKAAWESVQKIVNVTGYDYEHPRFNHREYRDIINSYLKAHVVGLEAPTDNILRAFIYDAVKRTKCRSIITGNNWATEGILPAMYWGFDNNDAGNIKDIHRKHGTIPLRETKLIGIIERAYVLGVKGVKEYRLLNHIDPPYNRDTAKQVITEFFGWVDHGRKHNEDRYTKFVECYIFPKKFGIDKPKAHYSTLICSEQMTRNEAIKKLAEPPYSPEEEQDEVEYFIRKLGIDESWFLEYINTATGSHRDYKTHDLQRKFVELGMKILGRRF